MISLSVYQIQQSIIESKGIGQIKILNITKPGNKGKIMSNYSSLYDKNITPVKPKPVKKDFKIQFVNQDLNDAIKEVKLHFKARKISKNNPESQSTSNNEMSNVSERLFFTNNYSKKYEERLNEIQEKRKQLTAKSLDKQMKARLQRKIRENLQLKDKMDLLKDLQERRSQMLLEKQWRQKQKSEEKKLLHESSLDKVKMLRKTKVKEVKKELVRSRTIEQESFKQLQFKRYLENKGSQDHHMLLKTRNQLFLTSQSTHRFRKMSTASRQNRLSDSHKEIPRFARTSQGNRNGKKSQKEEQELIIQQYTIRNGEDGRTSRTHSGKSQRKLNQGVRIISLNEEQIISKVQSNNNQMTEELDGEVEQKVKSNLKIEQMEVESEKRKENQQSKEGDGDGSKIEIM